MKVPIAGATGANGFFYRAELGSVEGDVGEQVRGCEVPVISKGEGTC